MEKFKKIAPIFIYLLLFANNAFAQGLVPCNGPDCTLCDVLVLANNVITLLIKIGLSLAGLFFAYGAFVIMTAGAGGSEKQMSEGRSMLWTVVIGVSIMLVAWLLIGTLLRIITGSPSVFPWNEIQCGV